jgi:hypothetical protein
MSDEIQKIRDALVGRKVDAVDYSAHGDGGGIRLTLSDPAKPGVIHTVVLGKGIYEVYLAEAKESRADALIPESWSDFNQMISDLFGHLCPNRFSETEDVEMSLVPDDDPRARQVGFRCEGCGQVWRIGISRLKAATDPEKPTEPHPWGPAMQHPKSRALLGRHLQAAGFQHEDVPDDWFAFFRGKGPMPAVATP